MASFLFFSSFLAFLHSPIPFELFSLPWLLLWVQEQKPLVWLGFLAICFLGWVLGLLPSKASLARGHPSSQHVDSLVHEFRDFMSPSNEESSITESDIFKFQTWSFIPSFFQMIILGGDNWDTLASDCYIAFNKKSLRLGFGSLLIPSSIIFLIFIVFFPPRSPQMQSKWLLFYIAQIELRCFLLRTLFFLKKHLYKKEWWHFSLGLIIKSLMAFPPRSMV